ncbi:hypothetical protein [Candidatus Arthromitus sp. SFB-rat-Yit]|uniref:hypothetical protein n=1 Tax=Candidatus Arthromitus sp. SFB-rat-Yit TaxID=1041504 RepID=UPI000227A47A|nr:hypothetical protein [Candidatus Arthromitus sp. SFB-rat-Yit]BAK81534.1 putative lipoprotein [Candidatus Arthromitus sp. SFB-rat-Yit]
MLKIFSKHSLKHLGFSLLTVFVLSGCANNTKPINTTPTQTTTETQKNTNIETMDRLISEIQKSMAKNWPNMNKIWPDLDYSNHTVIYAILGTENTNPIKPVKVWLLTPTEKRELSPEEYAEIKFTSEGGFNGIKFQGKDAIVTSRLSDAPIEENGFDSTVIDEYQFLTHELFHLYHQKNIALPDNSNNSRSQKYPIDFEPRLYRNMIHYNLGNAVITNDDNTAKEFIQKAAYWFNKWKNEYPDEFSAIASTDIFEGVAEYIGRLSNLAGQDTITREDLSKLISIESTFSTLGLDSYDLGFVTLSAIERFKPDFKEDFSKSKKSPIEYLLENVTPIEDTPNEQLSNKLKQNINEINDTLNKSLEYIISSIDNKNIPYLRMKSEYRSEYGFSAGGFFNYNGYEILHGLDTEFIQDSSNILYLKNVNTFEENSGFILIPLTDKFEINGDTMTLTDPQIKGTLKVTTSTEDGRTIYTVK